MTTPMPAERATFDERTNHSLSIHSHGLKKKQPPQRQSATSTKTVISRYRP